MKKVMKYPIYPIAFSYVNGIFFGLHLRPSLLILLTLAAVSVVLLFLLYHRLLQKGISKQRNIYLFMCIYTAFSSLGCLSFIINDQSVKIQDLTQREFTIRVDEVLKTNAYMHRSYASLVSNPQHPKVLFSFSKKDSLPKVGTVYKVIGTIKEIAPPRNLFDFNYKEYLYLKHIHYQITSYHPPLKMTRQYSIKTFITDFRGRIVHAFSELGYDKDTKGFIQALLLGIKTDLEGDLEKQFKDLGITHVLAVSGMHVILLFTAISFILQQFRISGRILNLFLIFFLVVFALLAGGSGSVIRAVFMCLMMILGRSLGARNNTANLLVGSMFCILLLDPYYLFDVGFQLSYMAVFSIVFCYPIVRKYFTFNNKVLNYFGQLIGVSLVVQLCIMPLSIYYFKQVPLLFLLGNILVIPLTSFLLVAWFVQLILYYIYADLASVFTPALKTITDFCFEGVGKLSHYFSAKTLDIHFGFLETLFLTLFIFCCFWYFYSREKHVFFTGLGLILILQLIFLQEILSIQHSKQFVLMSDAKDLIFLNRKGKVVHQLGSGGNFAANSLKNYQLKYDADFYEKETGSNVFRWNNEHWLVVDSLGIFPNRLFHKVVLCRNTKVNLDRLLEYTKPELVILHSSLSPFLLNEYKAFLTEKKVPYYDMRIKGAYVVNYN